MKSFASLLLIISMIFAFMTFEIFTAQVRASVSQAIEVTPPVSASTSIRDVVDNALIIIAGFATVVTALGAALILMFGKIKELKAAWASVDKRQDIQTAINRQTQDKIVEVALKTPTPITDNSVHINDPKNTA